MFKLKKGNIQAVCYTEKDVTEYVNAGWKLVDNTVVETKVETVEEKPVESKEETAEVETKKEINKYSMKRR